MQLANDLNGMIARVGSDYGNGIEHEYIQAYNKNGIDPNGKDPNGKDVNESNEKSEWIE